MPRKYYYKSRLW